MPATNNQRTSTSTQIRNMYSDGLCYLNISFFNTSLSLRFYPFLSKNNVGLSRYDMNNGQQTTIDFEQAFAFYQMCKDIIDGKLIEGIITIPRANNAMLSLERRKNQNNQYETVLTLSKNNVTLPFIFQTNTQQVKENGQVQTKIIESGLGAFMKTIEGYLTGINADRHLDKLTEEYAKMMQARTDGGQYSQQQKNNNNGYKGNNYGGRNNYPKKQYNGQQQGGWQGGPPNQQNMSGYNLPN